MLVLPATPSANKAANPQPSDLFMGGTPLSAIERPRPRLLAEPVACSREAFGCLSRRPPAKAGVAADRG